MADFGALVDKLRFWSKNETEEIEPGLWSESWSFLRYILSLPVEDLKNIALHTAFYGGFSPLHWVDWGDLSAPISSKREIIDYQNIAEALPEKWWISEREIPGSLFQKGYRWNARLISADTVRYQLLIANLYHTGILSDLAAKDRPVICEIGGGYGGLALELGERIDRCCYIIVDLPQTLFTSGVYIGLNHPEAQIYLCSETDTPETVRQAANEYDYILLSCYRYTLLRDVKVSLFLNALSFQEMSEKVLDNYARFISTFDTIVISDNWSNHPANQQLTLRVEDVLARYFDLTPDIDCYDTDSRLQAAYQEQFGLTKIFIGTPRSSSRSAITGQVLLRMGQVKIEVTPENPTGFDTAGRSK